MRRRSFTFTTSTAAPAGSASSVTVAIGRRRDVMPRRPGPTPHTADVVRLHGNRSKLTDEEIAEREAAEVKARPLRRGMPKDLSPYAEECWRELAPELEHLGLLSVLDGPGFRLACETYALARYALDELRARKADGTVDGRTKRRSVIEVDVAHGGNLRRHPAIMVYSQAAKEFRQWCVEFGLSPSARVSLRPGAMGPGRRGHEEGEGDDGAGFDFGF